MMSHSREPIFMDPRLIATGEATMKESCRFWHVVVYDDAGEPAACASLTGMTIDLLNHADQGLASMIRYLPGVLSRLRRLRTLICGLPLSVGQKSVALTKPSESAAVLSLLDRVISELAVARNMDGIVYKEFGDGDLQWTSPLLDLGYRRIPTLPMHFFPPGFDDFTQYCASLKAHYRRQILLSTRKLQSQGATVSVLHDTKDILAAYTPALHELYFQVLARAEFKLEVLPVDYFRELAARLAGQIDLVTIQKAGRIMAFAWGLHADPAYYVLYGGVDYELNHEFDLYFNLMYASLDCALRRRASKIVLGQTGDAFKARLGTYSEARYAFVKGVGRFMSPFIRLGAGLLIAQKPFDGQRNVFKGDPEDHPAVPGPDARHAAPGLR